MKMTYWKIECAGKFQDGTKFTQYFIYRCFKYNPEILIKRYMSAFTECNIVEASKLTKKRFKLLYDTNGAAFYLNDIRRIGDATTYISRSKQGIKKRKPHEQR